MGRINILESVKQDNFIMETVETKKGIVLLVGRKHLQRLISMLGVLDIENKGPIESPNKELTVDFIED